MRSIKSELCIVFVGAMVLSLLVVIPLIADAPLAMEAKTDCEIHTQGCQKELRGRTVELDIHPKPVTAMQDSVFRVKVSGAPLAQAPYIDLGMPGMHMGPNRVQLKNTGPGSYEGTGVIVRCKSGKRIWRATITLPDVGNVDFTFDVVY